MACKNRAQSSPSGSTELRRGPQGMPPPQIEAEICHAGWVGERGRERGKVRERERERERGRDMPRWLG